MEQRTLELELVSAKDVKNVNLFSKMSINAVVSLVGDPYVNNPMQNTTKTNLVRNCGTNPSFNNFPVSFTLNDSLLHQNRLSLHINLLSKRTLLADTPVGSLHVSLKYLLESSQFHHPNSCMQAMQDVSYQLRRPSGRPHGEVSFRYKSGEKVTVEMAVPAEVVKKKSSSEPVGPTAAGGYPAGYANPTPQESAYKYPPPQPGYGYSVAPPGYGYAPAMAAPPPVQKPAKKKKKKNAGMGFGTGLFGGLILGEMLSDVGGGCGGGGCGGGCGG